VAPGTVDEGEIPRDLVVDARPAPGDSSSGSGTAMLPFVLTAVVAGGLAKYVSPATGLFGLGAAVAILILLRKPREGRFVLHVADGVLEVRRERRPEPVARIGLDELVDVTLDRQRQQANPRGGSAAERTCIALERRTPEAPLFIPDERITSIEAEHWIGKIRVFLRKHGWVPEQER
jgi:hypothetical protein